MQDDKPPVFEAHGLIALSVAAMTGMIAEATFRTDRMRAAAELGYATATDLADYLVRKGLPFRDAHEAVARAVRAAEERGLDLSGLTIAELRAFSPLVGEDVKSVLSPEGSVAARRHVGGTAPEAVRAAIASARRRL
jgi:argininosuccinate lyase